MIRRMTTAHTTSTGYWGHLRTRHDPGATNLFLRAFLPFLCVLLLAGAAAFGWRMRTLDRELDATIAAFLTLAGERLQRDLEIPAEDLDFLAREFASRTALDVSSAATLANLAAARKRYTRLQVLDTSGLELASLADRSGSVQDAGSPREDWSRSNLFAALAALDDGELFISNFELRTDRGKIVEPLEPVVRFARPYADTRGQRAGFIVIELDARETLDALRVANPNGFVELVTTEGYWIKSHDPQLEWGGVLREREHLLFSTRNARAWGVMASSPAGKTRAENGGFWYRTVSAPEAANTAPSWLLLLHVPEDRLRARAAGVAMSLTALVLVAALMAAPFYAWLAHRAFATGKHQAASGS